MNKLTTLASVAILASPLAAQTRIHVDAAAAPGGDGSTWALAFQDLQAALVAADASAGDDELWVAAGVYHADPSRSDRTVSLALRSGVAIYGGFAGGETQLAERNPDPATNGTVLSGDLNGDDAPGFANIADNTLQIVVGTGTDETAILDGFTIRGGFANSYPQWGGGGLACIGSGSPTLVRCHFVGNKATSGAGAASFSNQSPGVTAPTLIDCSFIGNEGNYGGALDIASSQPEFVGCRFYSNYGGYYGGAIYNYYSASRIIACSFRGNRAGSNGGAIYFNNLDPMGRAVIANTEFAGNQAAYGGSCYAYAYAEPVFTNCSFQGNRATQLGGALYHGFSAVPRYANCIVWNNLAENLSGASFTALDHSITNSGVLPRFADSIVAHAGGSTAWVASAGTDLGGNLDADPLFLIGADPAAAPTLAGNLRLGNASAAANQGDNLADLDGVGPGTETIADLGSDLAGASRIQDATVDLGAFEGSFDITQVSFAMLHPALAPTDDANGNGYSNFYDYATGADPTGPDRPECRPRMEGGQWVTSRRTDTLDVTPEHQKSGDLSGWSPMVEGVDYTVTGTSTFGEREEMTMELLAAPMGEARMYFRQAFSLP